MTTWHTTNGSPVEIEINVGNLGSAIVELGKIVGGVSQPPIAHGHCPLKHTVPPEPGIIQFYIAAVAADVGGADLPMSHSVSQGGHIVRADLGTPPTINLPPYQPVRLLPDAKHNAPTYYYFDVSVA